MKLDRLRLIVCTVICAGAVVLAWLFGLPELSVLAVAAWGCAMAAAALHRWFSRMPEVETSTSPSTVSRGEPASLELRFVGASATRSSPARLHGRFATAGSGSVGVAALAPQERTAVALSLPTPTRGLIEIGPLHLEYRDPLSIWRTWSPVSTNATVLVRPRSHYLGTLLSGADPSPGPGERTAPVLGGAEADEDLVGLRPYVRGDDLRRIHWRTSARRNEAHVVQVEPPVQRIPVLILLDTRVGVTSAAFERAVEVAASIAVTATDLRRPVHLLSTAEGAQLSRSTDVGTPLGELLDMLALVTPVEGLAPTDALLALDERRSTMICSADPTIRTERHLQDEADAIICTADLAASAAGYVSSQPGTALDVDWDGTTSLHAAFIKATRAATTSRQRAHPMTEPLR